MKKKTFLIIQPNIFKQQISDRLQSGKTLLGTQVEDEKNLEDFAASVKAWSFYNQELLRNAFDAPDNRYVLDYLEAKRLEFTISYRENPITIKERVARIEKKLEQQIQYLEQILGIVPLMAIKESYIRGGNQLKERVTGLIEKNRVSEALDILLELKPSPSRKNEIILIKSSLNTIDQKFNLNLISLEEFEETTQRLKKAVLNLIDILIQT